MDLQESFEILKEHGFICEATSKEIYNVLSRVSRCGNVFLKRYSDSQFRTTFTCKTKGVRKADRYLMTSKGGLALRKGDQWVLIANDLAEIEDYFANR